MDTIPVSALSAVCKAAIALYSHYVSLEMDEKAMDQAFHIYDTWNIMVQDYAAEPEIQALEELMFGTIDE